SVGEISVKTGNNARNGGKNSLNRLIRCVCGKKIGPDPRNFNQRVSLGRNDLLIRTFPNSLFSFIANAQIIKKTVFPRSVIPLSNVMMEGLHFLCTIPVIVVFLFVYGMTPSLSWVWGIPLIAIGQVIFTFGVSIIFSTLNLFFRDLERFVSLGIMLMFYCTPILYASDMIPEKFSWIITYNPLASMILSWRDLFMNGTLNYEYISILYFTGIILTVVGLSIFNKLKYRFAEIL
ncbi:ABC transporter permease, partial [Klebsiella pneumoniae]|uniref:ABC transporter permease n=1 Tax=Klebsiella pneumoniae TaxID=573 RepID=UPI0026583A31